MKKIIILILFVPLFLPGCLSQELMKLASEYSGSLVFYDQAQKDLRTINDLCKYEQTCFENNAGDHFKEKLCPHYEHYSFISENECQRAGQALMDVFLGNVEFGLPVRNTAQDRHNDRMYELERLRLGREKRERERLEREQERNRELEREREERQRVIQDYRQEMLRIEREIQIQNQIVQEQIDRGEREKQIRQQRQQNIEICTAEALRTCIRQKQLNRQRYGGSFGVDCHKQSFRDRQRCQSLYLY